VEIHALDQLEAPDGVDLFVVFFRVEEVPSGGENIGSVVTKLLASGCPSIPLFERLTTLGVRTEDLEPSNSIRMIDCAYFRVDAAFPRLQTADVAGWPKTGIPYLRYGIDLAAAPPPLTGDDAKKLQREFVGQTI
jgi:hypothetical protein